MRGYEEMSSSPKIFFLDLCIYLAMPGLSRDTHDL